jgi:putative ABC transport system permease protein
MTGDEESYRKKHKALKDSDWKGRVVEVNTMYELASGVLKMEQVLDMITMIAVMVLFFIILIGVVNTLRMTIRERTREIGTVRAIGMQRGDVRWSFVLEVVLLAFFASLVGLGVGFLAMKLFSLPTIDSDSMFTMFLLDKHLYFLPTVMDVVKNLGIILFIAFVTSFFPANRAAKMSVADALRHFE